MKKLFIILLFLFTISGCEEALSPAEQGRRNLGGSWREIYSGNTIVIQAGEGWLSFNGMSYAGYLSENGFEGHTKSEYYDLALTVGVENDTLHAWNFGRIYGQEYDEWYFCTRIK